MRVEKLVFVKDQYGNWWADANLANGDTCFGTGETKADALKDLEFDITCINDGIAHEENHE